MKNRTVAGLWFAFAAASVFSLSTAAVVRLDMGPVAEAAGIRGPFAKVAITGTTENDVVTFYAHTRGAACYIWAPQAGTIKTYYINPDDVRREMDSRAVSATTLLTVDFDYRVPAAILTYTATVDPTGSNIEIECGTY